MVLCTVRMAWNEEVGKPKEMGLLDTLVM